MNKEVKPGVVETIIVGGGASGSTCGSGGTGGAVGGTGLNMGYSFTQAPTDLSFIEPHEEADAQTLIDTQFRELTKSKEHPNGITFSEHAKLTRYFCAVKLYVRPQDIVVGERADGSVGRIILPDEVRAEDRYQTCVGLVIALGPEAFLTKEGRPKGSRYKPGDWLVFARSDIIRIDYCDIALGIMTDDRAVIVTDDPTLWSVGRQQFKA